MSFRGTGIQPVLVAGSQRTFSAPSFSLCIQESGNILRSAGTLPLGMYRRNLPHWYPYDAAVFVTWRLFGTLPRRPRAPRREVVDGNAFREVDRQLDLAAFGPIWLREPSVAEGVAGTVEAAEGERGLCALHAYVVMPNHVHLLLSPNRPLCEVTKWIKGASARRANLLLGRTGRPFWQDESFDHWARNRAEFEKIRCYIEHNPVSAGLVEEPVQWPYSSARRRAQAERLCHGF